jgi:hypothetical protein
MSLWLNRVAVGPAALAFVISTDAAWAQSAPQSTAAALQSAFDAQGFGTEFGPIAPLAGPPTGRYDQSVTLPAVQSTLALYPRNAPPSFFVNASGVTSHVSGTGLETDYRSSEGDNALAAAHLMLSLNPPPPTANPVPYPPLLIDAKEVVSLATFSVRAPAPPTGFGATSFGSLTISGTLLGGQVLRYSGQIAPNTLAYNSPTVTIILNRQVKHGSVACSPTCVFTLTSMEVTAVDVTLLNGDDYGTKVSGHIQLNRETAR